MAEVSVYDARAGLSRIIDRALAGEEIVITRNGKRVAKLVPVIEAKRPRVAGALKGQLEIPDRFFDPLPDEILEDFYGKDGLDTVNRLVLEEAGQQTGKQR